MVKLPAAAVNIFDLTWQLPPKGFYPTSLGLSNGLRAMRRDATFPLLFDRSAVLGSQSTQEEPDRMKKQSYLRQGQQPAREPLYMGLARSGQACALHGRGRQHPRQPHN
jgi:hypothetical protein